MNFSRSTTVVQPSGSSFLTASMATFSISAIIIGVTGTGLSPEPTAIAVTASVTVKTLVYSGAISNITY